MEEVINRGEISKLKKEVLDKAELESEKIIEETKEEIKKKTKMELEKLDEELKRKIDAASTKEKERAESDIRGKKQEIKTKYNELMKEALDEVIDKAINSLKKLDSKQKERIYKKMIAYAKRELKELSVLEVPENDYRIVKSLATDLNLKKSDKLEFGIIAYGKNGSALVNLSIAHIKDELKEKIMAKVVDRL